MRAFLLITTVLRLFCYPPHYFLLLMPSTHQYTLGKLGTSLPLCIVIISSPLFTFRQLHEVQHNRTFSMCSLFSQIRDEKGPPINKTLAEMDKKCWGKNHDQENISNFLAKQDNQKTMWEGTFSTQMLSKAFTPFTN